MKNEFPNIPLDEFSILIRADGAYYRCNHCGKFARDQKEEGIAELIYCPQCGNKINRDIIEERSE